MSQQKRHTWGRKEQQRRGTEGKPGKKGHEAPLREEGPSEQRADFNGSRLLTPPAGRGTWRSFLGRAICLMAGRSVVEARALRASRASHNRR